MKIYNNVFIKDRREFQKATSGIVFSIDESATGEIYIELFDGTRGEFHNRVLEIGRELECIGFEAIDRGSRYESYEYDVAGETRLEKVEKVKEAYKKFLETINNDDEENVFIHNYLKDISL